MLMSYACGCVRWYGLVPQQEVPPEFGCQAVAARVAARKAKVDPWDEVYNRPRFGGVARGEGLFDEAEVMVQVVANVVGESASVHRAGNLAGVERSLDISFSGRWCKADHVQGVMEPYAGLDEVRVVEAEGDGQ